MDFTIWKSVVSKMREQEKAWPRSKKETRAAFTARLQWTAARLPKKIIIKGIASMKRRCELIYFAKGGHTEEGGRHSV